VRRRREERRRVELEHFTFLCLSLRKWRQADDIERRDKEV